MDILIKGMEMPKYCRGCRFESSSIHGQYCIVTKRHTRLDDNEYGIKRHISCPLVALPEHGNLIDGDKASTQIIAEICQFCTSAENGNCDGCLVQKCLKAIGRVPLIGEATNG